MKHEKIFKLENGSRVKVEVELSSVRFGSDLEWSYTVMTCEPRKRTWKSPVDTDCYKYRALSMEERREFREKTFEGIVKQEMVIETANELFGKLKPTYAFGNLLKESN